MPNICIVGFKKKQTAEIKRRVDAIMVELGKGDDSVTTPLPANVRFCGNNKPAPYLIVRHTNVRESKKIGMILNDRLNLDIEYEKLAGFLAAKPAVIMSSACTTSKS